MAVLGANGAGKTTLLRAVSGTLRLAGGAVTAGSVELGGVRLDRMDPAAVVRAGVVQVPEGRQVFEALTVEENLRAGGLATPARSRRQNRDRVYEMFPLLRERATQRAGLLSGGEQQMLAIARALMAEPAPAAARRTVVGPRTTNGRPGGRGDRRDPPAGYGGRPGGAERRAGLAVGRHGLRAGGRPGRPARPVGPAQRGRAGTRALSGRSRAERAGAGASTGAAPIRPGPRRRRRQRPFRRGRRVVRRVVSRSSPDRCTRSSVPTERASRRA